MYKCCWNCKNATVCAAPTRQAEELFAASKRFCCASCPVSSHAVNPYQERYCKQFIPGTIYQRFGAISRQEAEKLNTLTPQQLVDIIAPQTSCL